MKERLKYLEGIARSLDPNVEARAIPLDHVQTAMSEQALQGEDVTTITQIVDGE